MKKIFTLFFVSFLLCGCQSLQKLADSIRKPSLSIADVSVTDFAFDEIELTYDVQIDNPNPVAVQMLSYDYDFQVNNNDFIQGNQEKRLRIESSGESTFQIPMRLNFSELYNLFNSLRGKDTAGYQLAANLDFDLPVLGETTLPLKKSGNLPMLKLPKINLSSLKVDNISFSKADLVLNLNVDNPNGVGLLLNALSYNLDINGRNWIDGSNQESMNISQNNSNQISIPISLNVQEIGTSMVQLLSNSSDINYQLTGDLDLGIDHPLFNNKKTSFAFDEAGDVPLIR